VPAVDAVSVADAFLIGRQPIFDASLEISGFELLFRAAEGSRPDAETMTADVLLHAGLDMGLSRIVGTKTAFVNASRAYLVGEREVPLPSDRTVIEVLEDIVFDDEVVAGCRHLVEVGFTLALDDYRWRPGDEPLLELASIVKFDVLALDPEHLAREVERCSAYGPRLVAEKIETWDHFRMCRDLGFDLFQGYLLSRPIALAGRSLNPSRANCLRLISELCDPDTTSEDVQAIIETDPALSVRFLRAAGAGAGSGLRRNVRSIREGAVLLGQRQLLSWATLMLLSEASDGVPDQLAITMTRAKLSELIAATAAPTLADSAFTVGLVSGLDLHLGAPIEDILSDLPLAAELVDALLARKGPLGAVLDDVLDWETGRPARLRSGVRASEMRTMCARAVAWADNMCSA
jgi:EAL and modified HD-GYP domain-containing signal transduction protein